MEPNLRSINVKAVNGQVKTIQIHPEAPISQLKSKIQQAFGVPGDRQRLIFQGKLLVDQNPISQYLKENGLTIHMMARAQGPAPQASQQQQPRANPPPNSGMPPMIQQMMGNLMNNIGGLFGSQPNMQGFGAFAYGPQTQASGAMPANMPPFFGPPNPPQSQPPQFNPPRPNQPPPNQAPPNISRPQNQPVQQPIQPNIQFNPPRPQQMPEGPRQFSLPHANVQNIGNIINNMMGPGAAFPPPRMPQLNLERNSLVLLGGYLNNYQFQLMRLIPFVSRIADLMQRESLVTDPNARASMQLMAQQVGNALSELNQATAPICEILRTISIGQNPGQFQLRINGANVVSEHQIRQVPNFPQQPHESQSHPQQRQAPPQQAPPQQAPPQQPPQQPPIQSPPQQFPNQIPPQNAQQGGNNPQNPFAFLQNIGGAMQNSGNPMQFANSMISMVTGLLGGDQNMRIRDLMEMMNEGNQAESINSIALGHYITDTTLVQIMNLSRGNWQFSNRSRILVADTLRAAMRSDSPASRQVQVDQTIQNIMPFLTLTPEQRENIIPGIDFQAEITPQIQYWISQLINLTLDYQGNQFDKEFRKTIVLMVGNYVDFLSENHRGGQTAVTDKCVNTLQRELRQGEAQMIAMPLQMIGPSLTIILRRCRQQYRNYMQIQRSQASENSPAAALLATWEETLATDAKIQEEMEPQRPFSHSYRSSDMFASEIEIPQLEDLLFEAINAGCRRAQVDLQTEVPAEIARSYVNEVKLYLKKRSQTDRDFRNGRHEHLDQFKQEQFVLSQSIFQMGLSDRNQTLAVWMKRFKSRNSGEIFDFILVFLEGDLIFLLIFSCCFFLLFCRSEYFYQFLF